VPTSRAALNLSSPSSNKEKLSAIDEVDEIQDDTSVQCLGERD
jgi:hypothetical protein